MNINWKVRFKNPYFWMGFIAVILAAIGISPESLTSWDILVGQIMELLSNPFAIGCVAVAMIGYVNDPTTDSLSDSVQALSYLKPKKDDK